MNDPWNDEQTPEQVAATQTQASAEPVTEPTETQVPVEQSEPVAADEQSDDEAPAEVVEKPKQASLALVTLVSRGVPMQDAKKQLGDKAYE